MNISKIYGKTSGLTRSELGNLERLYRRKIPPKEIITLELAKTLTRLSHELRRGISVLINRKGKVNAIFLGDSHERQPALARHTFASISHAFEPEGRCSRVT